MQETSLGDPLYIFCSTGKVPLFVQCHAFHVEASGNQEACGSIRKSEVSLTCRKYGLVVRRISHVGCKKLCPVLYHPDPGKIQEIKLVHFLHTRITSMSNLGYVSCAFSAQ